MVAKSQSSTERDPLLQHSSSGDTADVIDAESQGITHNADTSNQTNNDADAQSASSSRPVAGTSALLMIGM